MKKDRIFDLFDGTSDEFVSAAIASRKPASKPKPRSHNIFLIAAAIAVAALLVGCGIVYVLKMQDLKLADREIERQIWDYENAAFVIGKVNEQVLTFSGVKGSVNYEASKAWYDFLQTYDADQKPGDAAWYQALPEQYEFYSPNSQEMVDKIDAICAEYGLKLMGAPVKASLSRKIMDYLGIKSLLLPDAPAMTYLHDAEYYEGGFFSAWFDLQMQDGEDAWPYRSTVGYFYTPKDCFSTQLHNLTANIWQERTYTTKSGHEVLILRSTHFSDGWAFCDVGDATVGLRLEMRHVGLTDQDDGTSEISVASITDAQMNQILDIINFDLKLTPGDPAILEGKKPGTSLAQTQNGYTVTVKEFVTDGYTAALTLGITGPEDVDLEQYVGENSRYAGSLGFTNFQWRAVTGGGAALNARPDGDGKANTVEFFGRLEGRSLDDVPFPKGGKCSLLLDGLHVQVWNEELVQFDDLWEQEGTWSFEIPIEKGDWREIEFVSEPVKTKVIIGWDLSGKDVYDDITVTSWKMRALGGEVTDDWEFGQADFSDRPNDKYPTLFMKDGSTICLNSNFVPEDRESKGKMIPLDEIEYLLLIDGTKLYPQK